MGRAAVPLVVRPAKLQVMSLLSRRPARTHEIASPWWFGPGQPRRGKSGFRGTPARRTSSEAVSVLNDPARGRQIGEDAAADGRQQRGAVGGFLTVPRQYHRHAERLADDLPE